MFGRVGAQQRRHDVVGERVSVCRGRGIPGIADAGDEQGDAHPRQPPRADEGTDEVGQVSESVQLGSVVGEEHGQRLVELRVSR